MEDLNTSITPEEAVLAPSTTRSVIGVVNYIVSSTIGTALLLGIIDYEKNGGDPAKRTVVNHLTSYSCMVTFYKHRPQTPLLFGLSSLVQYLH